MDLYYALSSVLKTFERERSDMAQSQREQV